MYDRKSVCAIVSLYQPDRMLLNRLVDVLQQIVEVVYLIDNSDSTSENINFTFDNVFLVRQNNSGITGAMNRGLKESKFSFDYYLFLDQDSFFERDTLLNYIESTIDNSLMITAPMICDYDGEPIHASFVGRFDKGFDYIKVPRTQLSGMLVNKECIKSVGLFDEDFFLNLGDTDWCVRACVADFDILVNRKIWLNHCYAEGVKKILFYKFSVSEPFRLYYRSRDSLRLIFKSSPFGIKVRLSFALLMTFFEIMFSDRKFERLSFFSKGFFAYIKGDKGAMNG